MKLKFIVSSGYNPLAYENRDQMVIHGFSEDQSSSFRVNIPAIPPGKGSLDYTVERDDLVAGLKSLLEQLS